MSVKKSRNTSKRPPAKTPSKKTKPPFDRYFLYTHSVQGAEHDAELLWKMMRSVSPNTLPKSPMLQEDFCATAALCYEWVKLGNNHRATGIDLDSAALQWGAEHHTESLTQKQLTNVEMIHGDVLDDHHIKPNVICALNFSYFFIKDRELLKRYFISSKKALAQDGMLILDAFGGPDYLVPHVNRRRNVEERFSYWWEIERFDAISHEIKCHLHFQRAGETRRNRVFSYDWRLWSIPEITEILRESGFKHVEYWAEGLNSNGDGNGKFKPIKSDKNCRSWITYLIAK
jgi:hypothetical protein